MRANAVHNSARELKMANRYASLRENPGKWANWDALVNVACGGMLYPSVSCGALWDIYSALSPILRGVTARGDRAGIGVPVFC